MVETEVTNILAKRKLAVDVGVFKSEAIVLLPSLSAALNVHLLQSTNLEVIHHHRIYVRGRQSHASSCPMTARYHRN